MKYPVQIRYAEEKDCPYLVGGYIDINTINGTDPLPTYTPEKLEQDLFASTPEVWALIAETKGSTVGFALFSQVYFAGEGHVMWVSQIYVSPTHRKRNVAYELVQSLKEVAQQRGYKGICGATTFMNDKMQTFLSKMNIRSLDNFRLFAGSILSN